LRKFSEREIEAGTGVHIERHQKRKTPPNLAKFLRWYWQRMGAPEARPIALLIFELYALALRDPQRTRECCPTPFRTGEVCRTEPDCEAGPMSKQRCCWRPLPACCLM
jgi:hypothetical protein